jgi:SAM-dependent methyltransferase
MARIDVRISRPLRDPAWRKRSNSIELNQARFESPSEPIEITDGHGTLIARCQHQRLPFADASIDRIVIEEVLELVRDDHSLFLELGRVVKPGGTVRMRVPNAGPMAGFDGFNLYRYVADVARRGVTIPEVREVGFRRHFSLEAIEQALGERFVIDRTWTSGTGLSELAHFTALSATTFVRYAPDRYISARPALLKLKRLDMKIPMANLGYWRWVKATRR